MLRYAILLGIGLVAGNAWAQQAPPTAATAAPPSPTQPAKAVAAMEDPRPGDYWTYEPRDEITGKIGPARTNVVTEVTPKDISVRSKVEGPAASDTLNVFDRSWNVLMFGPWKYNPSDGTGIRAPLTTGKTWTFQSNDINAGNGIILNRSGHSKVVGQETVTTKAGTFETFKIETAYSSHNAKDPTNKAETTWVTWYAPAIDHWVKRSVIIRINQHLRDNNTLELVEYGRKQ
jgi:hypothetical protein